MLDPSRDSAALADGLLRDPVRRTPVLKLVSLVLCSFCVLVTLLHTLPASTRGGVGQRIEAQAQHSDDPIETMAWPQYQASARQPLHARPFQFRSFVPVEAKVRPWQAPAVADGAAAAEAPTPMTHDAPTADNAAATATTAAKPAVLSALKAGSEAEVRAALVTALPALEAANPTPQPALSEMLSGKWEVKYTGGVAKGPVDSPTREIALLMYAAGFGPGAAALSLANRLPDQWVRVKTVSLEISQFPHFQSRSVLSLSLPRTRGGRSTVEAELLCDLSAEGSKILETGKEVRVVGNLAKLLDGKGKNTPDLQVNGGEPLSIPEQFRYTRDLFVTYLDDDLLVARDATGSPDILVRDKRAPRIPVVEPDAIVSG